MDLIMRRQKKLDATHLSPCTTAFWGEQAQIDDLYSQK